MKNKALLFVITVILGAIGAGLWELAFKPLLSVFSSFALNIVTFGLDSLRNGLYEEAAKGQFERVGIHILVGITSILVGITVVTVRLTLPLQLRKYIQTPTPSPQENIKIPKFTPRYIIGISLGLIFITTLLVLLTARIVYINVAANYFEQLATIAAPYMSEQERTLARSKFAQIKTREQYVSLILHLQTVVKENGATVIELNIF
jgi:hypothetical protein